jgi:hypothetical protein
MHCCGEYPQMRYKCVVQVHIGLETPLIVPPCGEASYCTPNLVYYYYCAPQWKLYRSTRPMASPPASPGPASEGLELAEGGPADGISSGGTGAESWGGLLSGSVKPR